MKMIARGIAIVVIASLLWPELTRYRAEHRLADASTRLNRLLRGVDAGDAAIASAREAHAQADAATDALPGDPRAPLLASIALILLGDGDAAIKTLNAAIADGEHPELTINLGRARSISGDADGAQRAYLRTAWASPHAIATLPKSMRSDLLIEVEQRERALRAGTLTQIPPLR